MLAISLAAVDHALAWPLPGRRMRGLATGALVAILAVLGAFHCHRAAREGIDQDTLAWGSSYLVRRAHSVELARGALQQARPFPAGELHLVFEGMDLTAFGGASGPRVWTGRPDLRVHDASDVRFGEAGLVPVRRLDGLPSRPIPFAHVRRFAWREDRFVQLPLPPPGAGSAPAGGDAEDGR